MLTRILLESYWLFAVMWTAVQFLLVCVWSWRRTRAALYTVWAGFIALPILLVISSLVVTDRERIVQTCHDLASYVETCNSAAIEMRLADDFQMGKDDGEDFLRRFERDCARFRISDVRLHGFDVAFADPGVAKASFRATARVRSEELPYEWFAAGWRLTFVESGGPWRLSNVERTSNGPADAPLLRDLIR